MPFARRVCETRQPLHCGEREREKQRAEDVGDRESYSICFF